MIITCENCHASYKLDDTLLDPAGSRVRCTNCGHVFIAQPPPAAAVPEDEARVGGGEEIRTPRGREFETDFQSDLNASPQAGEASGLDLDLDLDDTGKTDEAGDPEGLSLDLDLDLGDDAKGFAADTEDLENLDLDLDLDLEPVTTGPVEKDAAGVPTDEELDLEEIQQMLTLDDAALMRGQQPVDGDSEALTDLELDLGPTEEAVEAGPSEALELDLDLEAEETGVPQDAAGADATDLDLGLDLEEAAAGTSDSLDLDLDLDLGLEDAEGLPPLEAAGAQELDLNLEPLGGKPVQTETEVFEEQELDLGDIDMMLHADEEAVALGGGGDREKSGPRPLTDALVRETAEIAADLARSGEAELDVYGEETGAPRDPAGDDEIATLGEAFTLRAATDADGQTSLTAEAEPIVAQGAVAAAGRRRAAWPVVVLLLLALAGGGVYWARQQGLDLAFLSRLVGQEAADQAGNLKISTLAIDSRFVDNATAGRLFVISGKARNDYDHPRSRIELKGSILAKGKRLVGSETVFGGNVLTDLDLNRLEIGEIRQRLGLETGANDANLDVPPGGLVPFMVVFDNLPPDLEEFTIEVVSSR